MTVKIYAVHDGMLDFHECYGEDLEQALDDCDKLNELSKKSCDSVKYIVLVERR